MNYDILAFLVFIAVLSIIMLKNKKKLTVQKIVYPIIYIILYKTRLGLGLMKRISDRYRRVIILLGYCFIGFAFAGMLFISYNILRTMLKFLISPATTETGMALIYPGTQIPGIGYLSFSYWLVGLFLIALVHELAHGIMASAHNLKIKSSGFAVLGIIAPVFPAAFVEPDEKEMKKKSPIQQYSILAAGPIINIILAMIIFAALPYVADSSNNTLAPFEDKLTTPTGFAFTVINSSVPAGIAGIPNNTIFNTFNGVQVNSSEYFITQLYYCVKPGQQVTLSNNNASYSLITSQHPSNPNRAYLGIQNIKNIREVNPKYKGIYPAYSWLKELIRWIFLFNLFIGLTNLLPIFVTDGARILQVALLDIYSNKKRADKIWKVINLAFLLLVIMGLLAPIIQKIISSIRII
ncbi:MAG: site-2 protease family protein [Candidatus Woesearchaeota archaeon]